MHEDALVVGLQVLIGGLEEGVNHLGDLRLAADLVVEGVLVHDEAAQGVAQPHAQAVGEEGEEGLATGADLLGGVVVHMDEAGGEEEVEADAVQGECGDDDERADSGGLAAGAVGEQEVAEAPGEHAHGQDPLHAHEVEAGAEEGQDEHLGDLADGHDRGDAVGAHVSGQLGQDGVGQVVAGEAVVEGQDDGDDEADAKEDGKRRVLQQADGLERGEHLAGLAGGGRGGEQEGEEAEQDGEAAGQVEGIGGGVDGEALGQLHQVREDEADEQAHDDPADGSEGAEDGEPDGAVGHMAEGDGVGQGERGGVEEGVEQRDGVEGLGVGAHHGHDQQEDATHQVEEAHQLFGVEIAVGDGADDHGGKDGAQGHGAIDGADPGAGEAEALFEVDTEGDEPGAPDGELEEHHHAEQDDIQRGHGQFAQAEALGRGVRHRRLLQRMRLSNWGF